MARLAATGLFLLLAVQALSAQVDPPRNTDTVRHFKLRSDLLSSFWGKDVFLEAGIYIPLGEDKTPLPVCYVIHRFGGSLRTAWQHGRLLERKVKAGYPRMIHVFLQAQFPLGHHCFVDSVNNGPWASALVKEFIPAVEKKFDAYGKREGRFLAGHETGGWSALWLQLRHPDVFSGAWATSPDPVDFRNYFGFDIYSFEVAYEDKDEFPTQIIRRGLRWRTSVKDFVRREQGDQKYGGRIQSFDAVFGSRAEDGRPMPLFERSTGEIYKKQVERWKGFDISRVLQARWQKEAKQLAPQFSIYVGSMDKFGRERAIKLMRDSLRKIGGPQPKIKIVRDCDERTVLLKHEDFWRKGLMHKVHKEMRARFDAALAKGDKK